MVSFLSQGKDADYQHRFCHTGFGNFEKKDYHEWVDGKIFRALYLHQNPEKRVLNTN